jgi:hypothetical protein
MPDQRVSSQLAKGEIPWKEAIDPGTQHLYYYNTQTGETRWDRPEEMGAAPHASGKLPLPLCHVIIFGMLPMSSLVELVISGMSLAYSSTCTTTTRRRGRRAGTAPRRWARRHTPPVRPLPLVILVSWMGGKVIPTS